MFRRCEPPTFAPPTRGSRAPSSCSDDVRAPGRHRWSDDAARLCRLCLCGLTRLPSLGVFRRRGVCIAFACTRAPPYTLQRAAYTHLDLLAAFLLTHNVIRLACVRQLGLLGVTASTKDDPPPLPPPLPPAPVPRAPSVLYRATGGAVSAPARGRTYPFIERVAAPRTGHTLRYRISTSRLCLYECLPRFRASWYFRGSQPSTGDHRPGMVT